MTDKKGIPVEIKPAFDKLLSAFSMLLMAGCAIEVGTPEGRFLVEIADAIEEYEKAVIDF